MSDAIDEGRRRHAEIADAIMRGRTEMFDRYHVQRDVEAAIERLQRDPVYDRLTDIMERYAKTRIPSLVVIGHDDATFEYEVSDGSLRKVKEALDTTEVRVFGTVAYTAEVPAAKDWRDL